jgi:hypothetical protein
MGTGDVPVAGTFAAANAMMPGISGVQLAELLTKRLPDLRVLFVSGQATRRSPARRCSRPAPPFCKSPTAATPSSPKWAKSSPPSSASRRAERLAGPFDDLEIVG